MTKRHLTHASGELFRRAPDERFPSLDALLMHCQREKEESGDTWMAPTLLVPEPTASGQLGLRAGADGTFALNDWSFGQLCGLARVSKDTVNRLSPDTAARAFRETLPGGTKPLQLFRQGTRIRSVHGTAYTRLHNADLVGVVREYATDFTPPQAGFNGATGLYCGEQDLFCFLIDPAGWAEIDGEAFAPGFFVWNSEVGKRSVGIQTFWFQKVCANHIVWDAVEVIDFARKHTARVGDALGEIRRHIELLVAKRDERRDGFAAVIRKAMQERLGADAEEVMKVLTKHGLSRGLAKQAVESVAGGRFTIFALVDALTRLAGQCEYAGDRTRSTCKPPRCWRWPRDVNERPGQPCPAARSLFFFPIHNEDRSMKTYSGIRSASGCAVTVAEGDTRHELDPRFDLRRHSLTGFEWGYGGSGPAQLALALAADVLGDDEAALAVYQRLKFRVVGRLPADCWTLTEVELAVTLRSLSEAE